MQKYSDSMEINDKNIYLKIVKDTIFAYGDRESLEEAENEYRTGQLFDYAVPIQEWRESDGVARYVDGQVVLGIPKDQIKTIQEDSIRNERYLRLRQCDRISPMRWNHMTEEQRKAWDDYRLALLNIPQQEGFPWGGDINKAPWPKFPD